MWSGVRKKKEYRFVVIEEVMQQKAPLVPNNIKFQHSHLTGSALRTSRLSANFFKATFSSRIKAVPAATSSYSVEAITKIGSAETKPVTRNRPRTVPSIETTAKERIKKQVDQTKGFVNKPDKIPERSKPKSLTNNESGLKNIDVKDRAHHDLKSPNVVLQIIKKSAPRPPVSKESDSILPPTLKPRVPNKGKLKLTKNINNNDVWTTANDIQSAKKKVSPVPRLR